MISCSKRPQSFLEALLLLDGGFKLAFGGLAATFNAP